VKASRLLFILIVLLLNSVLSSAHADWVNFSGAENARNIAEIHINDNHVKVMLEIYVGDLEKFEELIPDDFFSKPVSNRTVCSGAPSEFF
jgi:hypothetical protein